MTHPLNSLVDRIVQQAERRGDLQNLSGSGKPLQLGPNPKDAVINRLMTESRVKPPVVALKEQISSSRARLKTLTDEDDRKAEMKTLADLELRLAIEVEGFRKYG